MNLHGSIIGVLARGRFEGCIAWRVGNTLVCPIFIIVYLIGGVFGDPAIEVDKLESDQEL